MIFPLSLGLGDVWLFISKCCLIWQLVAVKVTLKDLHSLWTGFYVRDYRLLQDQFPFPERPKEYNVFDGEWFENSTTQGTCIREVLTTEPCLDENGEDSGFIDQPGDFPNLMARKKRQATEPKICRQVYTSEFVSCEEKHNFVCLFKGYEAQIEMPQFESNGNYETTDFTTPSMSEDDFLEIKPTYKELLVKEGAKQELDCSFNTKKKDVNLIWDIPTESHIRRLESSVVMYRTTRLEHTVQIQEFHSAMHAGRYECALTVKGEKQITSEITLIPVADNKTEATFEFNMPKATLSCAISFEGSNTDRKITGMSWFKNGEPVSKLKESERFEVVAENNTLIINDPRREDAGLYIASFDISNMSHPYECEVGFLAAPLVLDFEKSKNFIQEDNMELQCKVKSYPYAEVTWYKDNQRLNVSKGEEKRIQQAPLNGYPNARLHIKKVEFSDAGDYTCEAYSAFFNESSKKTITIRVNALNTSQMADTLGTEVNFTTVRNILSLRISVNKSSFSEADDLCSHENPGSRIFRLKTSADRYFLDKFVSFAAQTMRNSYNTMLWTPSNTSECGAISMQYSEVGNGEYRSFTESSWPCDKQLRVVCMSQIDFPETPAPQMEINFTGSEIQVVPGEVQATSRALRYVGGLGPPQSSNDANDIFDNSTRLIIRCIKPVDVAASLYKSGLPSPFAHEQDEVGEPFGVYLNLRTQASYPYRDIDSAQSYHCEVMNQNNKRLLRSNSVYVRLSDYEIYSASIQLQKNTHRNATLSWSLLGISLTNTWKQVFTDEFYNTGQLDKAAVQQFMRPLNDSVMSINWKMEPLVFIPERKTSRLVFYIYKPVPGVNVLEWDYNTKERLTAYKDTLMRAIKNANLTEFNSTSLEVKSIDWCWTEDVMDQVTNRIYCLPDSPAGAVWKSSQICASDGLPLVTAKCEGDKFIGLEWGPLKVNPLCDYSNITVKESKITPTLRNLSQENVTTDNVESTVKTVKSLTKTVTETNETLSSVDVNYVADILQKSLEVDNLNQSTVQNVLDTVVQVSGSPDEVLDVAQRGGNGINRILNSVDRLGQRLKRQDSGSGPQRLVSGGLAMEVWDLTQNAGTEPVIGLQLLSDGSTRKIEKDDLISLRSEKNLTFDNTDVAILLSKDFIENNAKANMGADVRLAMNVYKDTKLFERNTIVSNSNLTLNSKVIAAQLLVNGQPIRNLGKSQVKTVFQPVRNLKTEFRRELTVCAYWDFSANEGRGDWADDGCSYDKTEEGKDICVCDHLTNFAVLVSYYDQDSLANDHQLALSIITIVGLSLSIAGLSLSILSFLFIQKLRKGRPQQTIFQLSLALLMSWIVFLAGVHQTDSHAGCIAVAALLHYLILASFMWMLMEGILQYLLFVRVMNTYFRRYMLKTSLLAWGLPILPVVIILGIDRELYKGGEEYCWMSLDAFYYGFAIPVGLIILANIIFYIRIVVSLCRRKDMSKHSSQSTSQTIVNIRASFICFFVLGLAWVFGFLAIEDARIVFQYLFCIFASLQGFIIFVMMTARDKQVRRHWASVCCRRDEEASSKSGTGSNSAQHHIRRPKLTSDSYGKYQKRNSQNNSTTYTNGGSAGDPESRRNSHDRQPAYGSGNQVLF